MKLYYPLISAILFFAGCYTVNNDPKARADSFSVTGKPEEAGFSAERLARIDSLLQKYVDEGVMPNAVTFVARHGKVVHNKAFGWKNIGNKIRVKTDDIFRIASQSKAITTVGLMMLFEEGKFLLDDPLSKYIPGFKNPRVYDKISYGKDTVYTTRPAKCEITIRHLLTHTSGITYDNILYKTRNKIYSSNTLDNCTIKEMAEKIAACPLEFDPGEKWVYGLNLDVAGYLIEVLSGMPLDQYFQKKIFEPLGMTDTYFYLPDEKANRLVTLYKKDSINGALLLSENNIFQTYPIAGAKTLFRGGGGLSGTISDYAKFCQMMLNGGRFNSKQILGRKTIDMMIINQIDSLCIWNKNKFGLGFELFGENEVARYPGSEESYKWGGMFATDYLIDPAEDMILLIYTNAYPFANPDIHQRFRILVYQALVQ